MFISKIKAKTIRPKYYNERQNMQQYTLAMAQSTRPPQIDQTANYYLPNS